MQYSKIKITLAICLLPILAIGQASTAIRLQMQLIQNLPHIQGKVDGQGPFLFGFDSGMGGELLLDSTVAAQLGITATDTVMMGDPSGRNNKAAGVATVKSIELGSYKLTNVRCIISNRKGRGTEQVAGIIGIPLFTGKTITLDYAAQRFVIEDAPLSASDAHTIPYTTFGGGVPGISITVGGHQLTAMVDTRSMSGGIKIPASLVSKLHMEGTPVLKGKGRTMTNTIDINEVTISEPISFAGHTFNKPVITYPSLSDEAIIGSAWLKQFVITIDPQHKLVKFVKAPESQSTVHAASANEYTGSYGERQVFVEDGNMYLQRTGGMKLKMVAIKPDEYSLEGIAGTHIIFTRDSKGKITELRSLQKDGTWAVSGRGN